MHPRTRTGHAVEAALFRPPRALGIIVGSAFTAWAAFVTFVAAVLAVGAPVEALTFVAWVVVTVGIALAGSFAYWTLAVATISYEVDDTALVIHWGLRRVTVPLDNIQRIVPGRTLDVAHVKGLSWWGCHVGLATVGRIGRTLFFSTHSTPDELVYVVTPGEAYALTVLDQAMFAEEVQGRAGVGALGQGLQRAQPSRLGRLPIWHDRLAFGAVIAGILGCATVVGYIFVQYPDLPDIVQLNFPEFGDIVRIGDKSEFLRIVYVGAGILVLNLVVGVVLHTWERAAGVWLLASSALLQVVLFGAAIAAIQRA